MNDLFSTSSFKKYTDLNRQARVDDIEGGRRPDLDTFFEEAESIKEDLNGLDQLYRRLQSLNEDTKTAHNAVTMKELRAQMDADTVKVLHKANAVKRKLEAVDRANAASRKLPGCGSGSSVDRTRTSVLAGLGTKLKDLMDGFQDLRARIAAEYKETVGRRYFTVTGERPDDDTVDRLISTGESESFLHKAIQDQGRGQMMDAISEMQERHDAVKEIEKGLIELHQVFLDMTALVEAQGQELNNIESHVAQASSFVRRGAGELVVAKECKRSSKKWFCLAVLLGAVLLLLLLMPILVTVIRPL